MSDKERKREQSMRLFEALADISPELLARSEKRAENKVIRLWGGRFGRYIAACLAILLVGGVSLYAVKYTGGWKGTDSAALQNGAGGASAQIFMQDSVREQIAEQIEAEEPGEEAVNGMYDGYDADMQQESSALSAGKEGGENVPQTEQQSSPEPVSKTDTEDLQVVKNEEKAEESRSQQEENSDKESMAKMSLMQNAAGYLAEADVARMGSLAAYAPVSLPQGYEISDTRIAVDESGVGNYVIVMRSEKGEVLEYRVSRGEEDSAGEIQESGEEENAIYVTDLRDGRLEEELAEVQPEERKETAVVALYEDDVRVEVRGDYTLDILLEICPKS